MVFITNLAKKFKMNMFLLFVIFSQFAYVDCLADDEQELLLVQAVWRHGDRSPAETFKTDRYQEQDWPQGWGQLSPVGMRQHVRLGQKLRRRYIQNLQFVSPHYNSHEIYVRSTDSNRTLISAISNLIGFYGPGTAEEYPQGLEADWPGAYVPIAVHTVPGREDFGAPNKRDCPRHRELKAAMWRTPEVQRTTEEHKWLLDLLTEKTGEPIDVFRLWMVAEAFEIEMINKRPLVDWAEGNQTLLDAIKLLNNREVNWINGLDLSPVDGIDFRLEVPRIRGGPILWKMIGNMRDKLRCQQRMNAGREGDREIEGKQSPLGAPLCKWMNRLKYIVYSAHDSTLASLFSALGFPKSNYDRDGIPEYSACLTMELWRSKSSGQHSVKLLLWPPDSEETTTFIDVTRDVRGCDNDAGGCTLEQFAQRSEPYQMLPSPEEYCQTSLTTTTTSSSSTSPSTTPNTPAANSSADPLRLHCWKFTMFCWLALLLSMLCAL